METPEESANKNDESVFNGINEIERLYLSGAPQYGRNRQNKENFGMAG